MIAHRGLENCLDETLVLIFFFFLTIPIPNQEHVLSSSLVVRSPASLNVYTQAWLAQTLQLYLWVFLESVLSLDLSK